MMPIRTCLARTVPTVHRRSYISRHGPGPMTRWRRPYCSEEWSVHWLPVGNDTRWHSPRVKKWAAGEPGVTLPPRPQSHPQR